MSKKYQNHIFQRATMPWRWLAIASFVIALVTSISALISARNWVSDGKYLQSIDIEQIEVLMRRSNFAPACENLSPENSLIPIQVLQPHSSIDIDQIFRDCTVLNFFFQDWVRMWFTSGKDKDEFEYCNPKSQHKDIFKLHIGDCFPEVLRGPIKSPNRAISKVFKLQLLF